MIKKGIYKHIASKHLYKVIGVGRHVNDCQKLLVIYEQLYESELKGSDIKLPVGHLWTREIDDFNSPNKFEYISEDI